MNVPKLLKQAEKLVSYGKINDAINLYQEVLSHDFQNTAVHNLITDLYISKQDYIRASRHLFKVSSDYASQGNTAEALNSYRKIIKIQPRNILAREKMMEFYSNSGAKNELFTMMAELCAIYEAEGNTQKVIEFLEKLVSLDPSNKSYQLKLAAFLNEKGLKEKAIELFYQLVKDYSREERWDDALEVLGRIRSINPKDRQANLSIAEIFDRQGKVQRAIEVIIGCLAVEPTRTDLLAYLARLCIKAGKVDEAERLYERLVKSNRNYLAETLPFVEVLIANKKIDRAVHHLGMLIQELKGKETQKKCVEYLEEILKLDPQNLETYQHLESIYRNSFQYDQLAITLSSHADAYIAKCDYPLALELTKQLADLEPYNEDYRRKLHFVEGLTTGGLRTVPPSRSPVVTPSVQQEEEEESEPDTPVTTAFDQNLSIVTDEDVESFLTDVELLEKFGQTKSAIARLEKALEKYPHEIKFRQKLKLLYVAGRMPKKAAQECLEIAKVLQSHDQNEEATKYIREAQRLNPMLSTAGRSASVSTAPAVHAAPPVAEEVAALKGDLSEIGLLDIIQVLDTSQKSGRLIVHSEGKEGIIFFNSGKIVDARFLDKQGELAMYALVAVNGGTFVYRPSTVPFNGVITTSNTNVILEGLRLLDEANRDSSESEASPAEEPTASPPASFGEPETENALELEPVSSLRSSPKVPLLDDDNPLDEL